MFNLDFVKTLDVALFTEVNLSYVFALLFIFYKAASVFLLDFFIFASIDNAGSKFEFL
jgi:hypothetical protein